jgi:16S rRNA (cytidine1402-2'-O)-methyltransferase
MKLTLITTPIGNIEDITIRALRAIFSFETILAEDTRNYIKLRNILSERFDEIIVNLGLDPHHQPELISYRDQNHNGIMPKIIETINSGKSVGFMSDAGMPGISDPGFKLVKDLVEKGIEIEVLPGATAVETALVLSGLPTDRYTFLGFLPRERSKIKKIIEMFKFEVEDKYKTSLVFFESPFRIIKTLEVIKELGTYHIAACNDLTKKFEQTYRGSIEEVLILLKKKKIQGEWCIVIHQA